MAHWKTFFDYKFLGCQDLARTPDGKYVDMIVTITSIERGEVIGENGKKDLLPIATLKGSPKPLILNKTNLAKLAALFATNDYENFVGKTIQLGQSRVKGKGGEMVDGLRIRDTKVEQAALPELTPEHARWAGAKKAIADGNTTLEQVKAAFSINPENEKLLLSK